jgi:hypothetical protein
MKRKVNLKRGIVNRSLLSSQIYARVRIRNNNEINKQVNFRRKPQRKGLCQKYKSMNVLDFKKF